MQIKIFLRKLLCLVNFWLYVVLYVVKGLYSHNWRSGADLPWGRWTNSGTFQVIPSSGWPTHSSFGTFLFAGYIHYSPELKKVQFRVHFHLSLLFRKCKLMHHSTTTRGYRGRSHLMKSVSMSGIQLYDLVGRSSWSYLVDSSVRAL